jgi:hypothetical protein
MLRTMLLDVTKKIGTNSCLIVQTSRRFPSLSTTPSFHGAKYNITFSTEIENQNQHSHDPYSCITTQLVFSWGAESSQENNLN